MAFICSLLTVIFIEKLPDAFHTLLVFICVLAIFSVVLLHIFSNSKYLREFCWSQDEKNSNKGFAETNGDG